MKFQEKTLTSKHGSALAVCKVKSLNIQSSIHQKPVGALIGSLGVILTDSNSVEVTCQKMPLLKDKRYYAPQRVDRTRNSDERLLRK